MSFHEDSFVITDGGSSERFYQSMKPFMQNTMTTNCLSSVVINIYRYPRRKIYRCPRHNHQRKSPGQLLNKLQQGHSLPRFLNNFEVISYIFWMGSLYRAVLSHITHFRTYIAISLIMLFPVLSYFLQISRRKSSTMSSQFRLFSSCRRLQQMSPLSCTLKEWRSVLEEEPITILYSWKSIRRHCRYSISRMNEGLSSISGISPSRLRISLISPTSSIRDKRQTYFFGTVRSLSIKLRSNTSSLFEICCRFLGQGDKVMAKHLKRLLFTSQKFFSISS